MNLMSFVSALTLFIEFSGRRIKKVRREIEAVVVTGTKRKGEIKSTRRTRCVLSLRQTNNDHSFHFRSEIGTGVIKSTARREIARSLSRQTSGMNHRQRRNQEETQLMRLTENQ